jgi:MinD-like ATPase involved in chromosome partitioning or flagellar assembly
MGVVAVCSGKSAGVTTLALAVAARWPVYPLDPTLGAMLLVEADPSGGDLAARFGLRPAPGLTSAAAAAGTAGPAGGGVGPHVQQLPGVGVPVLLAAASFVQAAAAVRTADDVRLIERAAGAGPVVVDVGRLDGRSVALPVAARADVAVVVCGPRWDEVAHAAATIAALRGAGAARLLLVLRGDGPLSGKDIAQALDVPVWGTVPDDRAAARILSGQARPGRGWVRLSLARSARSLATDLARELPGPGGPAGAQTVDGQAVTGRRARGREVVRP